MNITEELKEKLLKANSEEEVKAILGDQATEEEISLAWQEIERHRPAEGLEEVEDDELAAVSGGADRDYLTDGCSASVEAGSHCWSDDSCVHWDVTYDNEEYACGINKPHQWDVVVYGASSKRAGMYYSKWCRICKQEVECTEDGTIIKFM